MTSVDPTPVEADPQAPSQPAAARTRGRLLLVLTVLGVLLLIAVGVLFFLLNRYDTVDDRRAAALTAARQSALNLTSIDNENFDEDVELVLEGATGAFRQDFESRSADLKQVLEENQVVSEGKVIDAGLVRSDNRTATALVVVDSTVRNTQVPEGRVNTYRMQLELELRDGQWRTSMLEFVG